MISLLKGMVAEKRKSSLVVLTSGGVGYDVAVSPLFLASCRVEQELTLYTYLKVGQDALDLYGFANESEQAFFTLLLTVSGVGPKTAMNILSAGSIEKIQSAIARSDVAYLTGVSGLGKKTAERLVVELKSKVLNLEKPGSVNQGVSDAVVEVIDALVGMGYDRSTAKDVVTSLESEDKTTEALLKEALRRIK
jgi:Holliday junction DNA helicase RuvA